MAVIDAGSPRMPLGGIQDKVGDMQIIRVDSLDDGRLALYTQLTEIQLRNRLEPDKGIFIAESPKVIDRALAAGVEPVSFLVEEAWLDGMKAEFDQVDRAWGSTVPVFVASAELLHRLTGYRLHRGALSAMRRWVLPTVEEVCKEARRVAVLENIVDYTNVGAIMRSAAALDVDAGLVTPSCADPLYRRAARVSMGTVFQVPWTRIGGDDSHAWPHPGIDLLHRLGFTTVAMALTDDSIGLGDLVRRMYDPDAAADATRDQRVDKVALIFGTEGDGLSRKTLASTDLTVKITMSHQVDSLNVAASSAVAFYATMPGRFLSLKGRA